MDGKRKCDLPTPTQEKEGENEKKTKKRKSKAEEVNTSSKEPECQNQDLKEEDNTESNLKIKMELGTKRTKKPPKSLENFICRPIIRVSQKAGPETGDGTRAKSKGSSQTHQLSKNKCHKAPKTCSSTSTNQTQSAQSPSSVTLDSDFPNIVAAKKDLPKQTKEKTDLKSELTLEEPLKAQPQSLSKQSILHRMTPNTPPKQTTSHTNASISPTPSQQYCSTQEGIKVLNESLIQQTKSLSNCSQGSPSETKEKPCKRNLVLPKKTCKLKKKVSKHTDSNSEINLNVNANKKEDENCVVNSGHLQTSDTSNSRASKHNNSQKVCIQWQTHHVNDQPEYLPSVQEDGSSSPCKCTTNNLSETSNGIIGQNEMPDLSRTLEMTGKSCQAFPDLEQQKDTRLEESLEDEHGKRIKDCPNQEDMKLHCLSGSSKITQIPFHPANSSTNGSASHKKKDKKSSQKQKFRNLHSSKMSNITNGNNHGPTELQDNSQNDTPNTLFPVQCEQKILGQLPKSNQSKDLPSSEASPKNLQARKRGRPKVNKLEVPSQGSNLSLSVTKYSDNKGPDPEPVKQPGSLRARKRGRPKRSFSTQPVSTLKKQVTGDQHATSEDKMRDSQQKSHRSNRVIMKTIIRKINKMKMKRRDQVLTQILLGQKQRDSIDLPQERSGVESCSPASPATHSLSSLVTSFGGKLGPQINVSKRGTIYMGKRRGRKPKCEKDFNQILSPNYHQMSADTANSYTMNQLLESQNNPSSLKKSTSSCPGRSSLLNTQKAKATSFIQLSELQKVRSETVFSSNIGVGVNDSSTLDRRDRETNGRLAASSGFSSTLATGPVFTMSGLQGNNSLKGKSKALSSFSSEHVSSTHLSVGSGRTQDSNGTHIAKPPISFTSQDAHKFKCHRRGHHCLSHDKLRRHKCKKKYMQLRAKRQDPDLLAEVEDLVVRLKEIHIVHHITRKRTENDGSTVGRKGVKSKTQTHDPQCLQDKVHPPTMFQINLSGYYSPHSTLSCDPLHYVRMANMRKKHSCSSEPNEHIVTHFPVVHKLGYPVSGGGFFHPSYKVPFTTTSLGFGLYRGYPSATPLYPSSFPSSYMHHYPKNPIISPSKFHKKKAKIPKQDSTGHWGRKSFGTSYPRMTPNVCDCFSRQCWQREKAREGRDEHGRKKVREQDIEWVLRHNKLPKDSKNARDCPSSFAVFSKLPNKDKSFPSNLRQRAEVRWSEHQPPWRCLGGFESELGNRSLNKELNSNDLEDTLEEPESDEEIATPQQSSRTHSFLKQPKLFSQRKIRKGNGFASASVMIRDQDGKFVQDFSSLLDKRAGYVQASSLHFLGKHQCSSSRDPENFQRNPKGHKARSRPLILEESGQTSDQTLTHFMQEHAQPLYKQHRNPGSTRAKLTQHFKSSQAKNHGSEAKKRGPGRPRKNPPLSPHNTVSSPPCLFPVPQSQPSFPEKSESAGNEGSDRQQNNTALNVTEALIHGEQRKRGHKRKNSEKDDGQNAMNEEKDCPLIFHSSSALIPPSPEIETPENTDSEDSQSEKTSAYPANKKYLWAGLYSDDFKTEDVQEPQQLSLECVDYVDYDPEEHEHGLLPPPLHVGKYLRLKRIDFQLPYDIHWLCAHNKLFEKPDNSPPAKSCSSPCKDPNENIDDGTHTRPIDSNNLTDVEQEKEEEDQQLFQQQEGSQDNENFPSPLSTDERSFVMKHGVFLVRNYEKMRARQAVLLQRERLRDQEKEDEEEEEEREEKRSVQNEDAGSGEESNIQTGRGV
ncbi:histone-lysine N-methyltransferase ASH1L-like isoform X2 [Hoplias malabaricus]|uniref:histone-lysine N-methyltransferase ASH1L-like isoform X2 n=1 Tax=Hoplias malabaricus TaxID=27720 RepID=UPI0034637D6E